MCRGDSTGSSLAWSLNESGNSWQLKLKAAGAPEVELNDEMLRVRLDPEGPYQELAVPEHARPIDCTLARCSFSKKKSELLVQWPRSSSTCSEEVATTEAAETAPSQEGSIAHQDKASTINELATEDSAAASSPVEDESEQPVSEDEKLSADEWKTRGNEAVKASEYETAFSCYSKGLAVGGGDEAILFSNRALCLLKLERHQEAADDAKRCIALRPDFVKGYLRAAMALRALQQPQEALNLLKRCPAHDEAGALVAQIRPEAEAAEKARIAALSGADQAREEGNTLFRKGLFEDALIQYNKALELAEDQSGPDAMAVRNNRAACNHQLSDFHAVVKDTTVVLEQDPMNFKALVRRMLALEPLERYEQALADARNVLRQDPSNDKANKMQHRLSKLVRDAQRAQGGA